MDERSTNILEEKLKKLNEHLRTHLRFLELFQTSEEYSGLLLGEARNDLVIQNLRNFIYAYDNYMLEADEYMLLLQNKDYFESKDLNGLLIRASIVTKDLIITIKKEINSIELLIRPESNKKSQVSNSFKRTNDPLGDESYKDTITDFLKHQSDVNKKLSPSKRKSNKIWKISQGQMWNRFLIDNPEPKIPQKTFYRYLSEYRSDNKSQKS